MRTSTPWEAMPADRAATSISPETRGSRPMTATGRRWEFGEVSVRTRAAAAPSRRARGAVRERLARPRTPSVPKSLLMGSQSSGRGAWFRCRCPDRVGIAQSESSGGLCPSGRNLPPLRSPQGPENDLRGGRFPDGSGATGTHGPHTAKRRPRRTRGATWTASLPGKPGQPTRADRRGAGPPTISAWSTAGRDGPCADQPSCARPHGHHG